MTALKGLGERSTTAAADARFREPRSASTLEKPVDSLAKPKPARKPKPASAARLTKSDPKPKPP